MQGEVYDVDSTMLKKLDELEEHPNFYERTEEDVLLAPETTLKPGKTYEEVIPRSRVTIIMKSCLIFYLSSDPFSSSRSAN